MKTIQTKLPETLYNEAVALARSGWFRDEQEIISEALRRFLESHQPELMEQFIRDDVEWGLHGEHCDHATYPDIPRIPASGLRR